MRKMTKGEKEIASGLDKFFDHAGAPIRNINHVLNLAHSGKSVYHSVQQKHIPAAFIIGYPAGVLQSAINRKILYVYKKKK